MDMFKKMFKSKKTFEKVRKHFVVKDTGHHWDDNENFKAIPDEYKTLRLYMTHARIEGAVENLRELNYKYTIDDTLDIIVKEVDDVCNWYGTIGTEEDALYRSDCPEKEKNIQLIIKWLFEMFEDGSIYDVETREWSRSEDEEEEEDSDHSC